MVGVHIAEQMKRITTIKGHVILAAPSNDAVSNLIKAYLNQFQSNTVLTVAWFGVDKDLTQFCNLDDIHDFFCAPSLPPHYHCTSIARRTIMCARNYEKEIICNKELLRDTTNNEKWRAIKNKLEYILSAESSSRSRCRSHAEGIRNKFYGQRTRFREQKRDGISWLRNFLYFLVKTNIMEELQELLCWYLVEGNCNQDTKPLIFCTLNYTGTKAFIDRVCNGTTENYYSSLLIVDESSQAVPSDLMLANITLSPKHIVMVGDPKQLGCITLGSSYFQDNLGQPLYFESTMERLTRFYPRQTLKLSHQYRMHKNIAWFPNHFCYGGRLVTCVSNDISNNLSSSSQSSSNSSISLPPWLQKRVAFINVRDDYEKLRDNRPGQYINIAEATCCERLVWYMVDLANCML